MTCGREEAVHTCVFTGMLSYGKVNRKGLHGLLT